MTAIHIWSSVLDPVSRQPQELHSSNRRVQLAGWRLMIKVSANFRDPKNHINVKILQTMISGIRLVLGLGGRMSDPCVYVVF